jgi:hypothetical protein
MIIDQYLPQSYNLFLHKLDLGLCCAVPQDEPVPAFIGGGWELGAVLSQTTGLPRDFNRHAAQAAIRLNGYYLFARLQS